MGGFREFSCFRFPPTSWKRTGRQEAQDGRAGSRGRGSHDDHGRKQDAAAGRLFACNGDDDVLFLDTEAKGAEGRCRHA